MNNLSLQYPIWYLLLCLALGVVYAFILYFRDNRFQEQSKWLNATLGAIRALTIAFLATLLLAPLLKSIKTETQKPIIVIAQDVSESVLSDANAAQKADYQQNLSNLVQQLQQNYEVVSFSFGEQVRNGLDTAFSDKATNLSAMLSEVYDRYNNQNLGAFVLASDGIFNRGSNPIYTQANINAPIYAIALGDTIPKRDLILKSALYNQISYLGDRFAIQIDVAAKNCAGQNTNLVVSKVENTGSKVLATLPININQDDFFTTREVILEADKPGVQRYRLTLSSVNGEASTSNNSKDIFIDVLDSRQKILILANSPHPDITAFKQTLDLNKNYEIAISYASEFKNNIADFDFVLLHQLPSATQPITEVRLGLTKQKIPHFYIVGTQTNLSLFNQYQSLLTISGDGRNTDEVQPIVQGNFGLFTLEENILSEVRKFPPVVAPFSNDYRVNPNASVLLRQRIGRIETPRPLLLLGEAEGIKIAVFTAEGIWKWRLFDYLQHQNHNVFNTLVGKTIQYLSLRTDKRRFRVNLANNIFNENEALKFGAELYNESYELVNTPDAKLTIQSSEGENYDYLFNKTDNAYALDAGILPVGNYTFRGTTDYNGQTLIYDGQFSIQPIQLELYATTADHGLLRILSDNSGGALIYPDQINTLPQQIASKGNVKPVLYQTTQTNPIINLKWIFLFTDGLAHFRMVFETLFWCVLSRLDDVFLKCYFLR
ncbi:MAG: hypothetical protein HC912_08455 [Saprospiraceae bacterium]|nr:hypothetical protein [Saprospiraceae bacterium]